MSTSPIPSPLSTVISREVQFGSLADVFSYVSQFDSIAKLPRETLETIHEAITYAMYTMVGADGNGAYIYKSDWYSTEQLIAIITNGLVLLKYKLFGVIN